jgi:hypothetical protein
MCDGRHLSSVQFDVLIVGGKVTSDVASERLINNIETRHTSHFQPHSGVEGQ